MADPATLGIQAVSTMLSAKSSLDQGKADAAAANYKASTQYATGTRKAYEESRKGDVLLSDSRAAMAASGAAPDLNILAAIRDQADYNSLSAMFEGKTESDLSKYEGQLKKSAAKKQALGTVLSGASNIYSSYKNQVSR